MSQKFYLSRPKDPYEKWFAKIDAAPWLDGETIYNVDFTAVELVTNTDFSYTLLDQAKCTFSGTFIMPYVRGGTNGKNYVITMKLQTVDDPSYDIYLLYVPVRNIT
jgi:hypothetical protein